MGGCSSKHNHPEFQLIDSPHQHQHQHQHQLDTVSTISTINSRNPLGSHGNTNSYGHTEYAQHGQHGQHSQHEQHAQHSIPRYNVTAKRNNNTIVAEVGKAMLFGQCGTGSGGMLMGGSGGCAAGSPLGSSHNPLGCVSR